MLFSYPSDFYLLVNILQQIFLRMIFYFCLNKKDKIELAHDAALNHVTEKEKPRCKLSYKLFKEQDGYDPLLDISPFITLI